MTKLAGTPTAPWTIHDLRRSFSTLASEYLDAQPHVVEAVLNHQSGAAKRGVAGTYNRALYLPAAPANAGAVVGLRHGAPPAGRAERAARQGRLTPTGRRANLPDICRLEPTIGQSLLTAGQVCINPARAFSSPCRRSRSSLHAKHPQMRVTDRFGPWRTAKRQALTMAATFQLTTWMNY
jgi:hypothetical protein